MPLVNGVLVPAGLTGARVTAAGLTPFAKGISSPLQLAGCILWLDASRLALSDGASVSAWPDTSGLGNNATQGTSGKQPIFHKAQKNGLPVIQTDGVDDVLTGSLVTGGTGSVFVVCANQRASLVGSVVDAVITAMAAGSAGLACESYNAFVTTTTRQFSLEIQTPDAAAADKNGQTSPVTLAQGEFFVGSGVYTALTARTTYNVGSFTAGFFGQNMIGEIVVYGRALSPAERASVERYLGTKWGIAVS